ncbi:MAG: hypothetical protein ISP10_08895 [Aeromicrobium sp.]|jgi:hypothetical protein|nr:hypothetical protein [Aeromicrobium sp.]
MVRRLFVIALAGALALALVGCKSPAEMIGEKIGEEIVGGAVGGDVDVSDDSVTISTDEGDVTWAGGEGKLAEGFPSDFPVYPGSTVDASSKVESGGQAQYYAGLKTSDSVAAVFDWYMEELPAKGWTVEDHMQMSTGDGDSALVSAKKGNLALNLVASMSGDGTEIAVTVLKE